MAFDVMDAPLTDAAPLKETSLQERFIQKACKEKADVYIFLINGIKLEGQITDSDYHTILLEGKTIQLIYKRAVSTIMFNTFKKATSES